MGKIKSLQDYEKSIKKAHNELHQLIPEHPDYRKAKRKLSGQLTAWMNMLDISVHVAENEKLPYSSAELSLDCIQMSLKKTSFIDQVGDYQAFLKNYNKFAGLLIERKTLGDFYGTLMNGDKRDRFYREIGRYRTDKRFNRFILLAECTYEEFLGYVPAIYVCQWEGIPGTSTKHLIEYLYKYYKVEKISPKQIYKTDSNIFVSCDENIVLHLNENNTVDLKFNGFWVDTLYIENKYGRRNLYQKKGASEASKIETINSLENKIQISFAGSRELAVQKLPGLFRQWCRENYESVLNLS